ncbi:MAG: phytanoyl-CoA dioxygenase family protein [Candidatus Acidiferrum sp.]|jgi:ectoine hydroxylase-related dioxygenase (phytanoyl-CoA dioxygenase family)
MFRQQLEELGIAIEHEVIPERDIGGLLEEIAQCDASRSRAGIRHAMRHRAIAQFAEDVRLLHLAREVLGRGAFPFRATLFDKSPASNWLVGWHQDTALPLRQRRDVAGWGPWSVKDGVTYAHAPAMALSQLVALRVHLDDSTAQNGPLRVLPGTHTNGVLTDDEMLRLATTTPSQECVLPAGGILAMRPLIVHASSKSRSAMPRRVLHIEYAARRFVDDLELAIA